MPWHDGGVDKTKQVALGKHDSQQLIGLVIEKQILNGAEIFSTVLCYNR
jgi:hypothetical protein